MTNKQPIFQEVFGQDWPKLPKVMHKHYPNRPFSRDTSLAEGKMDVRYSKLLWFLTPIFRLFGGLVPYQGQNIPVTVKYLSEINSNAFLFQRTFYFPGTKPYHFNSKILPIKKGEVVELIRYGLGWKIYYTYENSKVILRHKSYVLKVGKLFIPLPLSLILGKNYCEEIMVSDNEFDMDLQMTHAIFGLMFQYKGRFKMVNYEKKD